MSDCCYAGRFHGLQRYERWKLRQKSCSQHSYQRHLNADLDSYMNWFFANGIRDYDCLVTTLGADYPDPSANLDPLLNIANIDIGGYNCAAYSNAEVDSLLTKTVTTTDESKRMDLLFQACDIIIADEPYYVYNHTIASQPLTKAGLWAIWAIPALGTGISRTSFITDDPLPVCSAPADAHTAVDNCYIHINNRPPIILRHA